MFENIYSTLVANTTMDSIILMHLSVYNRFEYYIDKENIRFRSVYLSKMFNTLTHLTKNVNGDGCLFTVYHRYSV